VRVVKSDGFVAWVWSGGNAGHLHTESETVRLGLSL
jgi:hypothetical protein